MVLLILLLILVLNTDVLLLQRKFHSGKSNYIQQHWPFKHPSHYQFYSTSHCNMKGKQKIRCKRKHPRISKLMDVPSRRFENWHASRHMKRKHRKKHKYRVKKIRGRLFNNPSLRLSSLHDLTKRTIRPSIMNFETGNSVSVLKPPFPYLDQRNKFKSKVKSRDVELSEDPFVDYEEIEKSTTEFVKNLRPDTPINMDINQPVNVVPQIAAADGQKGMPKVEFADDDMFVDYDYKETEKMSSSTTEFVNKNFRLDSPAFGNINQPVNVLPQIVPPNAAANQKGVLEGRKDNPYLSTISLAKPSVPGIALNYNLNLPPSDSRMGMNFQSKPYSSGSRLIPSQGNVDSKIINHQIQQAPPNNKPTPSTNATTVSSFQYVHNKLKGVVTMHRGLGKTEKMLAISMFAFLMSVIFILSAIKCYKYQRNKMKKRYPFKKKNALTFMRASRQQQKDLLKRIGSLKYGNLGTEEEIEQ